MKPIFLLMILLSSAYALCAPTQDDTVKEVENRIQQLRQDLLNRKSPESLLVPTLDKDVREKLSRMVARPYVSLQFSYSQADLRRLSDDSVELPVRTQWQTASVQGSVSGTMKFVRIGGEWYFQNLDFLVFPWRTVVIGSGIGLAFAVAILVWYFRSRRRAITS